MAAGWTCQKRSNGAATGARDQKLIRTVRSPQISSPVRAAMLSDYPLEAAATPALLAYVAVADWGCAYASAGDQRRSRTQTMITHSQKSAYGRNQISDGQKKRLSARPRPLMIAHQPSQRPRIPVATKTQPAHTAKLARANHALAKAEAAHGEGVAGDSWI